MDKEPTTTRSIRLPIVTLERIRYLANKRRWSVNSWIVNTIERESKPRI